MQAARQGDYARAKGLFQAVLEQDPDHEEACLWLAALAEDPEQSMGYLQRVLDANPDNARAQAGLQWTKERIQATEALSGTPIHPAWGGTVSLVPLEPERARWRWWHVVGPIGGLLLAGALVWWRAPGMIQLVELAGPEATATESRDVAPPPATDTPLPLTVTTGVTVVSAVAPATPLLSPPTATAPATMVAAVSAATPSPVSPTMTATVTPTVTQSSVPTAATVWPTPGPTTSPQVTPEPGPSLPGRG